MAHTITIEATQAAMNQFCNVNSKKIRSTLRNGLELEKSLTFVNAEHTYTAPSVAMSDILQPYQPAHTPNNTETWTGVSNTLQHGKTDLIFTAEQLQSFYNKWRCNWFEMDKDPSEWSYPRYIIDNHVMPKVEEEMNLASWGGVRVDPTPGTPGTYLQSWDGFGKKISDAIIAGFLVPIPTGPILANTAVDQVRNFCKALPNPYRYKKGVIYMSKTNAQKYSDDWKDKYPTRKISEENHDGLHLVVDDFNKTIIGLTSMEGSDRIVVEFPDLKNMIIGNREGQSMYPNFRFQVFERSLKLLAEVSRFYGFEYWGHVFVNDQT